MGGAVACRTGGAVGCATGFFGGAVGCGTGTRTVGVGLGSRVFVASSESPVVGALVLVGP